GIGAGGKAAHFVRDNGEATAMFTSPCCLDGSIERQQVGLVGNAADGGDDGGYFGGLGIELIDLAGGVVDLLCNSLRDLHTSAQQISTIDGDLGGFLRCGAGDFRSLLGGEFALD